MIEAVNSVISNAPLLRGSADQVNSTRAALPESVTVGPQAPFVSPYISVDVNFDTAVLQIRDSDTGDVVRQFPSESALTARQRAQAATESVVQVQEQSQEPVAQQPSSGSGEVGVSQPQQQTAQQQTTTVTVEAPPVAEAQVAAQALSAGAQTGQTSVQTTSSDGGVSVVA